MSYQVEITQFNGPLDLLLQLIERSQLEVTGIALADITNQYLAYLSELENLEPDELNWFIDLASRLMYLKSLALLPTVQGVDPELEIQDLSRQLVEYGRYQLAARHLSDRFTAGLRSWERPVSQALPIDSLPLPPLEWNKLEQAFRTALAKLPLPSDTPSLKPPSISLSDMSDRLRVVLQTNSSIQLSRLQASVTNRQEMIVMFLAILELVRSGFITVMQTLQYDDILLTTKAT